MSILKVNEIAEVIRGLTSVETKHLVDSRYIGRAMTMLTVLSNIVEDTDNERFRNSVRETNPSER